MAGAALFGALAGLLAVGSGKRGQPRRPAVARAAATPATARLEVAPAPRLFRLEPVAPPAPPVAVAPAPAEPSIAAPVAAAPPPVPQAALPLPDQGGPAPAPAGSTGSALARTPVAAAALAIMAPERPPNPPPPPSADEVVLHDELAALVEHSPGTELGYAVCEGNGEPCRARIQGREADAVAAAASAAAARYAASARVLVHELPTAYNGRFFVADIEMPAAGAGNPASPTAR